MSGEKITPRVTEQLQAGVIPAVVGAAPFAFPQPRDPFKPEKVAIIGTQPSSRMLAPYNDPTWTIWGTSPGNQGVLPRVDAWFEMHCNFLWPQFKSYGEPYLAWLNAQPFPVMAMSNKLVARAIRYPIEEMIERFGVYMPQYGRKTPLWFTSTFAYCMAFAIAQGAKAIGLYGVDMSSKDEYIQQRPGGYRFIEFALEAGIEVIVPDESDLLQPPPLYGYDQATPYGRKLAARDSEVAARIQDLEQQMNQIQSQLIYLKGAREDLSYMRQVYGSVDQIAPNGFAVLNGGKNGGTVGEPKKSAIEYPSFGTNFAVPVRTNEQRVSGNGTGDL